MPLCAMNNLMEKLFYYWLTFDSSNWLYLAVRNSDPHPTFCIPPTLIYTEHKSSTYAKAPSPHSPVLWEQPCFPSSSEQSLNSRGVFTACWHWPIKATPLTLSPFLPIGWAGLSSDILPAPHIWSWHHKTFSWTSAIQADHHAPKN